MAERDELEMSSVETQLLSLYTERELLERELGTADPDRLVALVRELEGRAAAAESELERAAAALPAAAPMSSSPAALLARADDAAGEAWNAVLERVGGEAPSDVLAHLDELSVRLVAAEARAARAVPMPTAGAAPLQEVVASLRALATELCDRFERSELNLEGETTGARWSVRCSSGAPSAS